MSKATLARTGILLPTPYSGGFSKVKVMDNRKDPPFFNEDSVEPYYYKLPFYDTMELFIETLTGTCFELRVSPLEAVISVKAKIQRLEGIPTCQQHLIWNNTELEDDYCLNDYNISEGSTLKLVLAMRGGPINTRKVPMEDPLREMAEYADPGQDEIWEKTSCNKQVTYLVYREGEQLNFFRVVDRGDGTLTPVSESLSGGSVYNLYTDEDEEVEPSPSGQQIIENSITMNKMKLLKAKMEHMNLSKKPKKVVKVKPRPPIAPRSSSSSTAAARHRLRVLPHIGQSCLSSSGNAYISESSSSAISSSTTLPPADRPVPSITSDFLKEDDKWESNRLSHSNGSIKLPPQITHVELENDKEFADCIFHLGSSLSRRTKHFSGNLSPNNEDDTILFPTSEECVTAKSLLPEMGSFSSFTKGNIDEQSSGIEGTWKVNPEFSLTGDNKGLKATEKPLKHVERVLSGESLETTVLNNRELRSHKNRLLSPLHCSTTRSLHNSLVKPQRQSKCFESGNLQSSVSQNVLQSLDVRNRTDSSFSRTTRFRAIKVDSPGNRSDIISKGEARDITEMANKASKEPVGCVNNIDFLASLARSTNRDGLQSTGGIGRLWTSGIGLSANLQHVQEECVRKSSPQLESTDVFLEKVLITSHLYKPPFKQRRKQQSIVLFVERKLDWLLATNADVETTSVHLIAMQKLMAAPMITRVQGGDTCRRQILWLTHQNFQKSNSCSAPNCPGQGIVLH